LVLAEANKLAYQLADLIVFFLGKYYVVSHLKNVI